MGVKVGWNAFLDYYYLMRFCREYFFLALVVASALFFKTYQLDKRMLFGWDQERDAQVVWQMLKEGKFTLIGPRVVSPNAFFLGPLWYYLLVPFYALTNLDPIGAGIFGAVIGITTTLAVYGMVKQLSGVPEALMVGFVWSTFSERVIWNPSLVPLLVILVLWACIKISQGKQKYIAYVLLLFGLGLQVHFQAVALIFPVLLAIYYYYRKTSHKPVKAVFLGIGLIGLTMIPLLAFDLRHEFINSQSFIKFFFSNNSINIASKLNIASSFAYALTKFLTCISGLFPAMGNISSVYSGLIILAVSISGIFVSKFSRQAKSLLLASIFGPLVFFSFYKGNLSEYYFDLVNIPVLIGLVLLLKLVWKISRVGKLVIIAVFGLVFEIRLTNFLKANFSESAYYKKQAVFYIARQTRDPIFNVSYTVPLNADAGFRYLFKLVGRQPQDIPEGHLWTIVIPPTGENIPPVAVFGNIGVIRR